MSSKRFPSPEYELLSSLSSLFNSGSNKRYSLGVGDDAAVRETNAGEKLILTADTSVENVHFSLDYMTLPEIAYRAMVTNVSDCASMGATPDSALIQLVIPKGCQNIKRDVRAIYRGISKACSEFAFPIVGGDLAAGNEWVIAITLIGRQPAGEQQLKRDGARHEDDLWVSGTPGQSRAGLEVLQRFGRNAVPSKYRSLVKSHVRPSARVSLGQALVKDTAVHGAIDISDGISKEALTLSHECGLGILLDESAFSAQPALLQFAADLGKSWVDWYLHGGEDYELLFVANSSFNPDSPNLPKSLHLTKIGKFSRKFDGVILLTSAGEKVPVQMRSWDHLAHRR